MYGRRGTYRVYWEAYTGVYTWAYREAYTGWYTAWYTHPGRYTAWYTHTQGGIPAHREAYPHIGEGYSPTKRPLSLLRGREKPLRKEALRLPKE